MNREELLHLIAEQGKCTKKEAVKKIEDIDFIIGEISKVLDVGNKVKLGRYLILEKVEKKERLYINPKTKKEQKLNTKNIIKVKGTPLLKKI